MVAAREARIKILRHYFSELCGKRFNVDKKMKDGWSALTYGVLNGHLSIVSLLLKEGADVNKLDKFHRNPLHWACRFNNIKIADVLL